MESHQWAKVTVGRSNPPSDTTWPQVKVLFDHEKRSSGVTPPDRYAFVGVEGTHDDFNEYDRVMADEGRVAVFVAPERILGNY